jgi:hypothetical protein
MLTMSQSKIKAWNYCPAVFYRQYILGLSPYNPKFDFGTNYHKLVEMYHKRQDKDYERDHRSGEIVMDANGHPVKEYIFDRGRIAPYADLYPADWYDVPYETSIDVMDAIMTEPDAPLVEQRFSLKLQNPLTGRELPVPFTIIIDGIRLAEPERGLYDLKTSMASWNQNMADSDIQAGIYIMGWLQMTGDLLPFNFIVARKAPGPRTKPMQLLKTSRTVEQLAALHDELYDTVDQIMSAKSYPCYCAGKPHAIKGVTE